MRVMATLLVGYTVVALSSGLGAFLLAGETPPEKRGRVWTLIAMAGALWPAALAYVLFVAAEIVSADAGHRGATAEAAPPHGVMHEPPKAG